jgi:uncharacterized tellurite resistance protein B-like protein
MPLASLANVLKVFRGDSLTAEEHGKLDREVLLMTLARASRADMNVANVEIGAIQRAMREATGEDLSEADIRVAARSELFESESLQSALAKLSGKLTPKQKSFVAQSLADVIRSDMRISDFELEFFDSVAQSLRMRPSEIAGLNKD